MSEFLEYYYKLMAQNVKSDIKDTIFLHKLDVLPSLPEYVISCKIDVVGLYPSISQEDELIAMQQKSLESWQNKTVSTDSLFGLTECVLKNNIFEHNTSFYIQLKWSHLMQLYL